MRLAVFVSPHGFGHAARASAVMEAIAELDPAVGFEIFTSAPAWFFAESLGECFRCHSVVSDVGMAQHTSFLEDLPGTVRRLARFLPFDQGAVALLAEVVRSCGCRAVLCDISPLGIAVAAAAGLPSVLLENFTWDFIYRGYAAAEPRLEPYARALAELVAGATVRVRTAPACGEAAGDFLAPPVSRRPRSSRQDVRRALGVDEDAAMVLLSTGGFGWSGQQPGHGLTRYPDVRFVIPGGAGVFAPAANLVLLPHHSPVYHPDLVSASDAVVGKVGYSTLAETYRTGVPFGYVPREAFPESPWLERFVAAHMSGVSIPATALDDGSWVDAVPALLALPRCEPVEPPGAEVAARFLSRHLGWDTEDGYRLECPSVAR
jgi:hypothetical protein